MEGLQDELKKCRTEMYNIENEKPKKYGTREYLLLCQRLRFLENKIDDLTLAIEFFTRYPENPK